MCASPRGARSMQAQPHRRRRRRCCCIGSDLVVAAARGAADDRRGATRAVIDPPHVTPVASFIHDRDFDVRRRRPRWKNAPARAAGVDARDSSIATRLATALSAIPSRAKCSCSATPTRRGSLPVARGLDPRHRAQRRRGDVNLAAFRLGRFIAAYPERIDELTAKERKASAAGSDECHRDHRASRAAPHRLSEQAPRQALSRARRANPPRQIDDRQRRRADPRGRDQLRQAARL